MLIKSKIRKLKVVILSQINCLNVLLRHDGQRCLRHSFFALLITLATPNIAHAASIHQRHERSSARVTAAFLSTFCSQPGSDLNLWESQVW